MQLADWIASGVAALAAVFAGLSWWQSRRSAKAALASASAADRSATAAEQSAEADQENARLAREQALRDRVKFKIEALRGDTYTVANWGTDSAYEVMFEVPDVIFAKIPDTPVSEIPPYSGHSLLMHGGRGKNLTVSWQYSPREGEARHASALLIPNPNR